MKKTDYLEKLKALAAQVSQLKESSQQDICISGNVEDGIYYTGYNDASSGILKLLDKVFIHNLQTEDGKKYAEDYVQGILDFHTELNNMIEKIIEDSTQK